MSERNGDKAKYGRERKRKILRRQRTRELQRKLGLKHREGMQHAHPNTI